MARPDLLPTVAPQKSYQPEKWTARHRMIAKLSAVGFKNNEIAKMMDMTPGRVSVILSDQRAAIDIEEAVTAVSDNIIDLHDRMKAYAYEALDEIIWEVRECTDVKVRQRAAFGILDRAGYTPVQKHMEVAPELPADVATRVEKAIAEVEDETVEAEYEFIEDEFDPDEELE